MSEIIKDAVLAKNALSPSTTYLLLITLNLALVQLSIPVVDAQTAVKDANDEEAKKAIAKAPAGNPGVDNNPRALVIMTLLVGPSLPTMLLAATEEEVRGWKGRRAWRLAAAEKKSIS
jgi:hypothetical protein